MRRYSQDDARNLGCSHYFGRGRESTRFDPENCVSLCTLPCHSQIGHGEKRDEYKKLMIKKLGERGLALLELRANQYKKRDDAMDEIIIKELLKEVKERW